MDGYLAELGDGRVAGRESYRVPSERKIKRHLPIYPQ
jgi:hypothetical protein